MPARSHSVDIRVRYGETDQMGVVYHANYLVWCEVGRVEFLRAAGVSYRDLEASGVRLAVADASLRYRAPARYDDVVRVTTTLVASRSRMISFEYAIDDAAAGTSLATAATTLVSLDAAGRPAVLPADLRALLHGALDA